MIAIVGQIDGIGNATSDSSSYEDISDEYVNPSQNSSQLATASSTISNSSTGKS